MQAAVSQIRKWREQPSQMVRDLFNVEPDIWQAEALDSYPTVQRMAMKACAGPGKTATLAWIALNFLLTRPHPMIGVTSITGDNLKANLWTELARWRDRSELLKSAFNMTKTQIFARDHPETWKIEARTWARDADDHAIGNALRGLHSRYIMWLLDESGNYPNAIMPVCENIFSGSPEEAHIIQVGNPTQLDGPLYRACTVASDIWKVIEITGDPDDPKRSSRISIEHARQQIKQYGRDNPWVMINILGKFPPSSINALIGPDEVSEAMKRYYRPFEIGQAAKVLGVDVARDGAAASVIMPRHGIQMLPPMKYRNINSTQGAGQVSRKWEDWSADACFVDNTGGFGAGWIDQLVLLGRTPIGVHFAGEAHQKSRYYNKRAEMAFDFVEWIKRGGALPDSPELRATLPSITYTFAGDRFLLEPKEDIEARLGFTLDEFDAAILTFAEPVTVAKQTRARSRSAVEGNYNPFADLDKAVAQSYSAASEYNPFRE